MFGFRNLQRTDTVNGVEKLRYELAQAEAVVIGAGAGLSTSAGFTYSGERFQKYFHDFTEKYHFTDMYSGGFYPYDTLEEHWAYWSRYIPTATICNGPQGISWRLIRSDLPHNPAGALAGISVVLRQAEHTEPAPPALSERRF